MSIDKLETCQECDPALNPKLLGPSPTASVEQAALENTSMDGRMDRRKKEGWLDGKSEMIGGRWKNGWISWMASKEK